MYYYEVSVEFIEVSLAVFYDFCDHSKESGDSSSSQNRRKGARANFKNYLRGRIRYLTLLLRVVDY